MERKHLLDIIFDGRTVHLVNKNRFTRDVKQCQNYLISKLYHLPRIAFTEDLPLAAFASFEKEKTKVVRIPCHTVIYITVLHKLISRHPKD